MIRHLANGFAAKLQVDIWEVENYQFETAVNNY